MAKSAESPARVSFVPARDEVKVPLAASLLPAEPVLFPI